MIARLALVLVACMMLAGCPGKAPTCFVQLEWTTDLPHAPDIARYGDALREAGWNVTETGHGDAPFVRATADLPNASARITIASPSRDPAANRSVTHVELVASTFGAPQAENSDRLSSLLAPTVGKLESLGGMPMGDAAPSATPRCTSTYY